MADTQTPPAPPPEPNQGSGVPAEAPGRSWDDADLATLDRIVRDLLKDYTGPPSDPPRGLLPPVPVIEALIAREGRKHPMTPAACQRLRDDFSLSYFFGDQEIAYRRTPQGVEVLAVGLDEVGALARSATQDELDDIIFTEPVSWW